MDRISSYVSYERQILHNKSLADNHVWSLIILRLKRTNSDIIFNKCLYISLYHMLLMMI